MARVIKLPCNVICDALLSDMHYWEERAEHFAEQLAELPADDPVRVTVERLFDRAEFTIDIISACLHTVQRVYKEKVLK